MDSRRHLLASTTVRARSLALLFITAQLACLGPHITRVNADSVYPTCAGSPAEAQWNMVYNTCKNCIVQSKCPPGCCVQGVSPTQFLICMAPGCCIRFIQSYDGEPSAVIASDGFAQKQTATICSATITNSSTTCVQTHCALELKNVGLVSCPAGFSVPPPGPTNASSNCVSPSQANAAVAPATTSSPQTTQAFGTTTGTTPTKSSPQPVSASPSSHANASSSLSSGTNQSSCFPSSATVRLASGELRTMAQLAVGDFVQVAPGLFSEVFMFTHKVDNDVFDFLRIVTSSSHEIIISESHFLYVDTALVSASQVEVGDVLHLSDGHKTTVTGIQKVLATGLYNPQTLHGDIVVNDIVVSTYTSAIDPIVAHATLLPFRSLYEWTGWFTTAFDERIPAIASKYFAYVT